MISPRYSNDRVDSNDAKKSFFAVLPYSIIAFIVLFGNNTLSVLEFVLSKDFKMNKHTTEYISMFCSENSFTSAIIQVGMVLCGMIMAFTLFRFLLSKKTVNVYLSMGITRNRLYFNRVFASVCALFLATFIPMFIAFIVNLVSFGYSAHLFNVFCYEFLVTFSSGLAGFALAAVVMIVSGCLAEALITTLSISLCPWILSICSSSIKENLLRGYAYSSADSIISQIKFDLISIWSYAVNLDYLKPANSLDDYSYYGTYKSIGLLVTGKKVPNNLQVDMGILLPIIIWLVISIILVGIGCYLINERKSENSNSFGKFYISSAINGVTVYTIVLAIVGCSILASLYSYAENESILSKFYQNASLCLFVLLIVSFIAFFVAMLIFRRNIKATLKTIPVFAACFVLTIFATAYFTTGYFGSYNKLPDTSEIESASMDIIDERNMFSYWARNEVYYSKDVEDIKTAMSLFDELKDDTFYDSTECTEFISFSFKLKDGTMITRQFRIFNPELVSKFKKEVYATNYYKNFLKRVLIDSPVVDENDNNRFDNYIYDFEIGEYDAGHYKNTDWYYVGSDLLFDNYDRESHSVNGEPILDVEGLTKAIYNDLVSMSYDDIYHNNQRPIGCLMIAGDNAETSTEKYVNRYGWLQPEYEYNYWQNGGEASQSDRKVAGLVTSGIMIYPQMTNTIAFLKEQQENTLPFSGKVKEVYVTSNNKSFANTIYDVDIQSGSVVIYGESDTTFFNYNYFPYNCEKFQKDDNLTITRMELFNEINKEAGQTLTTITDTQKAAEIISKSVPFYSLEKPENGRYIYVLYDNNVFVPYYIPQANVSVLG